MSLPIPMGTRVHQQLVWRTAAALSLLTATACGRAPARAAAPAPAAAARTASPLPGYTAADVRFMSGMIGHHQQAIVMCGWAAGHGAGDGVRILCGRIVVAQQDEIAFMRRWLQERREPVPPPDTAHTMHGPPMPGMLTPDEMAALDRARGAAWDDLLLRSMIRHHQGAITMVEQLIDTPGAAQDAELFRFVSDVNADQSTEIERMTRLLAAMNSGRNP